MNRGGTTGPEAPLLEPIAPAPDPANLSREISALRAHQCLLRSGELSVHLAEAGEIPHTLYEIGRQREIAFRAVGEGTGRAIDLDWYDSHYAHLVLWNDERREVIGGYRIGLTDRILPRFGVDGLYTAVTFDYRTELLARFTPALELGRSFVRLEDQKRYSPLLLLWRGIAAFVARHPQYRLLFGAASISNDYSARAQEMIIEYLRIAHHDAALGRFVAGRTAVDVSPLVSRLVRTAFGAGDGFDSLERRILALEGGRCGVPILIKQYLRLGGRFLGFSRDPDFRNSIDALVLVHLLRTPPRMLERFFGREELATFLEDHRRLATRRDLPTEEIATS